MFLNIEKGVKDERREECKQNPAANRPRLHPFNDLLFRIRRNQIIGMIGIPRHLGGNRVVPNTRVPLNKKRSADRNDRFRETPVAGRVGDRLPRRVVKIERVAATAVFIDRLDRFDPRLPGVDPNTAGSIF